MPTVENAGATIYYDAHGSAGDPLLCIMGLGGDVLFWERQIPAFAARHRVIVFDNRGSGRSSKPPGPYSIAALADDARAVLDAAGVARAHVVGISMGGMIAQELVLRHPERVGALVLAATYAKPADHVHGVTAEGAAVMGAAPSLLSTVGAGGAGGFDLASIDLKELFKFMTSLILSPEFIQREKEWLRDLMKRVLSAGPSVEAFLAQVAAVLAHDTVASLGQVRSPTLVLTGTADRLVPPAHSDELARLIPGAKLVRIEGGTHGFNIELAERFNREVVEFLAVHPL
jgi:pimeloyl-ACP methyl ester carboxylesterase